MSLYVTIEGDMVDAIAHRALGDAAHAIAILKANPGLAFLPAVLPAGVEITLPEVAPPVRAPRIRLWGSE